MRMLRILGGVALPGAAYWFDTANANRWISTFLIVAGGSLLLLGSAWFAAEKPGSRDALGLRYTLRVVAGLLAAAAAIWLFIDGQEATSAVTTWGALALLTYQAPWWPQRAQEAQPTSSV